MYGALDGLKLNNNKDKYIATIQYTYIIFIYMFATKMFACVHYFCFCKKIPNLNPNEIPNLNPNEKITFTAKKQAKLSDDEKITLKVKKNFQKMKRLH